MEKCSFQVVFLPPVLDSILETLPMRNVTSSARVVVLFQAANGVFSFFRCEPFGGGWEIRKDKAMQWSDIYLPHAEEQKVITHTATIANPIVITPSTMESLVKTDGGRISGLTEE
jgi:hypothetical protein